MTCALRTYVDTSEYNCTIFIHKHNGATVVHIYTHNSSNNSNNNNVKLTHMQVNTSSESPQTPYQGTAAHGRLHTWTCPIQAKDNATTGYR